MFGNSTPTTKPVITRKTIKSMAAGVYLGIAALGLSISSAQATLILNVDGGGQLTGAQNVDVNGTLYDVTFVDGSCVALFDGCDEIADFDFSDGATARAAGQALLDQVLTDTGAGMFDTEPELTLGCTSESDCTIFIPHGLTAERCSQALCVLTGFASNGTGIGGDGAGSGFTVPRGQDFATVLDRVYARFQPARIPEPSGVLLFGLGLAGLVGIMRRRRRRQPE